MTLQRIEESVKAVERRMNGHSSYVVNDMPLLAGLRRDVERLWVSDHRFKELEEAVAVLAAAKYKRSTWHPAVRH